MTAFVVAIAMCYVLIKIPFWILGSVKISQGRSVVGSMVKAFVAYKTAGLLGGGAKKAVGALASRRVPHAPGRGWTRHDPYENTTWTAEGQGVLPLPGVSASSRSPRAEAAGSPRSSAETRRRAEQPGPARRGQSRQGTLLTQQGAVKPLPADRRRPPHPGVPREARPGEQTMLRVFARHEPERAPRESVHDELSRPRPVPPSPPESEQPALFTTDGRLRSHARPLKPQPGDVPRARPGEQMPLNMPLRLSPEQARRRARHLDTPSTPTAAEPDESVGSSRPVRVKGQQPLLRQDGAINPRARARVSTPARARARQQAREAQRRRVQSAPPPVQFQPPPAGRRRGRTPAAESPRQDAPTLRRSTRLNPPETGTDHRGKDSSDD